MKRRKPIPNFSVDTVLSRDGKWLLITIRITMKRIVLSLLGGMGMQDQVNIEAGNFLTRQQREVYARLLEGKADKIIADEMNIGVRTVKFHKSGLFMKFKVGNRNELLRLTRKQLK